MKKIAISQSNYIPWKGYFDMIKLVDEFVCYDDVQYTRRDWRNRNKIKTPQGAQWLSIPVQVKGKYFQKINETLIDDASWAQTHWRSLKHSYGKAKHFDTYAGAVEAMYAKPVSDNLSDVNQSWLSMLCGLLGITTKLTKSSDYKLEEDRNARLISICKQAGATDYYSGQAAKCYLDEAAFAAEGIRVHWMEYDGYAEYPQLHPPFDHYVSVLDLLFNVGPDAPRYMKSYPCESRS